MVDRKIASWPMWKIITSYLLFWLAFLVIVLILFLIQGNQEHEKVQQALNEACGVNVVFESDGSFHYDPVTSWDSRKASCDLNYDHEWECHCFDTSP